MIPGSLLVLVSNDQNCDESLWKVRIGLCALMSKCEIPPDMGEKGDRVEYEMKNTKL